jgi:hypothetical protein
MSSFDTIVLVVRQRPSVAPPSSAQVGVRPIDVLELLRTVEAGDPRAGFTDIVVRQAAAKRSRERDGGRREIDRLSAAVQSNMRNEASYVDQSLSDKILSAVMAQVDRPCEDVEYALRRLSVVEGSDQLSSALGGRQECPPSCSPATGPCKTKLHPARRT